MMAAAAASMLIEGLSVTSAASATGVPRAGEGAREGGSLASALLVDGAHPAEVGVMLTDLGEPFARDATPAGNVLQEGDHVVGSFGSAETHEEDGVVGEIGHARTVGPSLAF